MTVQNDVQNHILEMLQLENLPNFSGALGITTFDIQLCYVTEVTWVLVLLRECNFLKALDFFSTLGGMFELLYF